MTAPSPLGVRPANVLSDQGIPNTLAGMAPAPNGGSRAISLPIGRILMVVGLVAAIAAFVIARAVS